ncbi:MAG: hypothetical protein MJZ74_03380 [Muribaculaceae bacterium]|nr:hypothetical protein [Muribaculaceae bacterium]
MRKTVFTIITAALVASCGSETSQSENNTSQQAGIEQTQDSGTAGNDIAEAQAPINVSIEGSIDHTQWTGGVESTVTFNHFPKSVAEFNDAVEQLGQEPQGAVVLMLMAMELYRNDSIAGEECLKTINTDTNLPGVMRQLKDKLRPSNPKDSYARPYLVAAFMQGATPENGYNAPTPYKVKVRTNPVNRYEESNSLKGYVLYLQVESLGYDTSWRGVEVCKSKGDSHYRIVNCPSMYTQCKEISWKTDSEFQGLK